MTFPKPSCYVLTCWPTPAGQPLAGVLHAGGVLSDALIQNQTIQSMRAVFAPKVHGLRNIITTVGPQPVLALKLFSSVAASLGSAGQANYAAANAAMDSSATQCQDMVSLACRLSTLLARFKVGLELNETCQNETPALCYMVRQALDHGKPRQILLK